MSGIDASLVKLLRNKTGLSIMACKKALVEVDGDMEKAEALLFKKGLSSASKKSGRVATEGQICRVIRDDDVIMLEINSETDFVAKNDNFIAMITKIANVAIKSKVNSVEQLLQSGVDDYGSVDDLIKSCIIKLGENIVVGRMDTLPSGNGKIVGSYVHSSLFADDRINIGKVAAAVVLESDARSAEQMAAINVAGKQLAMHVAAFNPRFLNIDSVPQDFIDENTKIFTEELDESKRNSKIADNIVSGKLHKLYRELVFLEQYFVIDNTISVAQMLDNLVQELGCSIKLLDYRLLSLSGN